MIVTVSYTYKLRVFINSQVTRPVQSTDARAMLTAVTTSYSTIIIDYTHSVKATHETVADDVLTSGQLYGMTWRLNV